MQNAAAPPTCPVCLGPIRAGDPAAYEARTGTLTHLRCPVWPERAPDASESRPIESFHSMFGPMG